MGYRQFLLSFPIAFVSILSITARAAADEKSPEELLASKGLRKLSASFSLPEEAELSKQFRDVDSLRKKLRDLQREVRMWQKRVNDKKKLIIVYLQKRRQLRAQLPLARSAEMHNRIVHMLNELADRIVLMQEAGREEESLKAARAAANEQTETYIQRLLETRQLYEKVEEKYKDLAADPAIEKAIDEYNKTSDKTYKLGPGTGLLSTARRLEKLENAVLSESIDLRQGPGRLWYVPVMFNRKYSKELAIDTGASIIALPWNTAKAVGLTPTEKDPTLTVRMADGKTVEAKQVFAETVRVGKFTVENVECAVMPPELTQAPPLLGLSFLSNFSFKIDTSQAKLIMATIESPDSAGRSPRHRR